MRSRAALRAIVASAALLGLGELGACVLADPPAALPVPPLEPPEINRASAVPPLADILQTWPAAFVIPVSADPRAPDGVLEWQFLVDQTLVEQRQLDIDADGGLILQFVPVEPTAQLVLCHTLEVRVFYENSTGGDDAAWFYVPTGNIEDCPVFDAGPVSEDAGADADAAGDPLDAQAGSD